MPSKLAHLILAHAYPKQLERLINRLQHADADIYIHLDAKSKIKDFIHLQCSNVFFVKKRTSVVWGTYSLVQATLDGMYEILHAQRSYSHINLLSAQDYPLKSADEIQRFFQDNTDKSFLDSPVIGEGWMDGVHRVENFNFGDYKFPGHYLLQYAVNFLRIKKRVPAGLIPYGRSQWFTITPQCAEFMINYLESHPDVKRYFRMSFAPDEFIFQTILGNSPLKDTLVNDNLRYINFPAGHLHPTTITTADAVALTTCGKLYARKFDPRTDSVILNYLDWVAQFGIDLDSQEFKCLKYIFNS
ncbi:beta-1,6-N-acetylglucosaminyltransferase [Mucilaginibacter sp. PAMB04274]|uniref:beta-1,6-N-acetylglucosaminyltransferase n=1 Tax=Mucilaginibacter sp. PAMB04274 TaxID=3138568 RepID=UPI0031F66E34